MEQVFIRFIRKKNEGNLKWHLTDIYPGPLKEDFAPTQTFCGEAFFSIVQSHTYVTRPSSFVPPHSALHLCTQCLEANLKGRAVLALCNKWIKENPDAKAEDNTKRRESGVSERGVFYPDAN